MQPRGKPHPSVMVFVRFLQRALEDPANIVSSLSLPIFVCVSCDLFMADPFALVTGVAGLISLGLEITILTRQYVHGAHNASKDVRELLQELSALDSVLRQLGQLLENDRIDKASFNRTSALFQTQGACEAKLKEMYTRLAKRHDKSTKALAWPFTKKEHLEAVMAIHRWVQTFQLALTVDGWYAIPQNKEYF